jgi:hypothetical protein
MATFVFQIEIRTVQDSSKKDLFSTELNRHQDHF